MFDRPHNLHLQKNKNALSSIRLIFCLSCLFLSSISIAQPDRLFAERLIYIDQPLQVISMSEDPGDDRLFIPCHDGKIWIYENGELLVPPFLDIGPDGLGILDFGANSEQGLNGMALDPNFDENGLYYITFNGTDPDGNGDPVEQRIMCYQRDEDNPLQTDYDSWYEVLVFEEGDDVLWGHNGGQMFFRNGHLFVSCGDGGSTGNGTPGGGSGGDDHGEFGNGQNLQTLEGKILRIDVHGAAPYTIPADNPYVDDPEVLDEIWSYGWRNPWRFSFDKETGDMFIGDVGEVDWEEINFEPADTEGGLNYGWRLMEGNHCYEPIVDCDNGGLEYPIFEYPHDNGWCAVIGGFMYRGTQIPTLQGYYLTGDGCGFEEVKFWLLWQEDDVWMNHPVEIVVPGGIPTFGETRFGFGEDRDGELYMCTKLAVYKIIQDLDVITVVDKLEDIKVYPNPASDNVVINIGEGNSIDRLELWDASGRKITDEVLIGVFGQMDLNVSGYDAGAYTLKVHCNGNTESATTRLVIHQTPK
jgi:hypothetical protein